MTSRKEKEHLFFPSSSRFSSRPPRERRSLAPLLSTSNCDPIPQTSVTITKPRQTDLNGHLCSTLFKSLHVQIYFILKGCFKTQQHKEEVIMVDGIAGIPGGEKRPFLAHGVVPLFVARPLSPASTRRERSGFDLC